MVANNDQGQELRANRLWSKIAIFLERGNRDAKDVADVLQVMHDDRKFAEKLLVSPAAGRAPEKSTNVPTKPDHSLRLLRSWSKFYHRYFGIQPDFSGLMIPPRPEGFDFLIVVLKGITSNRIVAAMRQAGIQVSTYTEDLDSIKSDREPTQVYAIWVRNRQEADEELKNLSANKIKEMGLKTETLPERLLHGFKFWDESHIHLDVRNITLCAGSRLSDGGVPDVRWGDGRVKVGWYFPSVAFGVLRSRQAVS